MKEKRRLRRIGLVCNVITSGPPKPATCQLSEDIPAISPISTCSVFIHDAMYTPKICKLSVNLHFKDYHLSYPRKFFATWCNRPAKARLQRILSKSSKISKIWYILDSTCSDHAPSMDIRPGVPDFQLAGLLIRKIVLFHHISSYFY